MKLLFALLVLLLLTSCVETPALTNEGANVADGPSPSESAYKTTGGTDADQPSVEDALPVAEE